MSLSLVCSSSYSNKKGIGSVLMDTMIELGKISDYTDIILEVANEFAGSEDSDGESDDESDDEYESDEYDSDEYDDEYDSDDLAINDFFIIDLTREFYRKILRHKINPENNKIAYYNVGDDYIESIIYSYFDSSFLE